MALQLPPYPATARPGDYIWVDWYRQLQNFIQGVSTISWASLDKSGSNLADIQTRLHNDLQSIQGGQPNEYYHLTQAQWAVLGPGIDYDTAAFAPTFTNLTVVTPPGSSYATNGRWVRINNLVTYSFALVVSGGATTSCTRGTTYFDLPFIAGTTREAVGPVSVATRNTTLGIGDTDSTTGRVYPPAWTTEGITIQFSGQFYVL